MTSSHLKADTAHVGSSAEQTVPGVKFTATSRVWLTGASYSFNELREAMETGNATGVIDACAFSNQEMGDGRDPWSQVGIATITVELSPKNDIVAAHIATLQQQLDDARAEWLTKQQAILARISKLQALEYVEAA